MTQAVGAQEAASSTPVWMDVQKEGDRVVISVLAAWSQPLSVVVDLDVAGGSTLHTANRATLVPDRPPLVLSRAVIDGRRPWTALLNVNPDGAKSYSVKRSDRD